MNSEYVERKLEPVDQGPKRGSLFHEFAELLKLGAFWGGTLFGVTLGFIFFAIITIYVLLPWFGDANVERFEQYHQHLHQHQQHQHEHGEEGPGTGSAPSTDGSDNS
jgi:hypothetical protein